MERTKQSLRVILLRAGLEIPTIVDLEEAQKVIEDLGKPTFDCSEEPGFKICTDLLRKSGVPEERIDVAALGMLLGVSLVKVGLRTKRKR